MKVRQRLARRLDAAAAGTLANGRRTRRLDAIGRWPYRVHKVLPLTRIVVVRERTDPITTEESWRPA
jgi:hypothetical protein